MQSERVQICSTKLLSRGCKWSKMVPLSMEASVDDILMLFAKYLLDGQPVEYPDLQACFQTLLQSQQDCLFVFMRRGTTQAAGILKSNKPLCSERERALMRQLGQQAEWNIPVWIWKETHHTLAEAMERQCRNVTGPCIGIWCYR